MKKVILGFIFMVIILAGFGFWVGRPHYKRYQEQRLARQAQGFMQKKEYSKVWLSARRIFQINPANVAACRLMADLAELSHSPNSLVWRRKVAELEPTIDNRLALASSALRFENPPFPLATKTLEAMEPAARQNASYHVVCANRAIKLNQFAPAEFHFLEAGKLEPANQLHQLNLTVLRLESPDPEVVAEARSRLEGFSAHPQYGIMALRSLAAESLKRKDLTAAERFSKLALANTNSGFNDQIEHLSILQEAPSAEFNGYLGSLQKTAGTNVANIHELAAWMNARGLPSEALAWLNSFAPSVQSQQPLPVLMADCYMSKKDWPALEKWLREQKWGGQDFLRWAMIARALRSTGEKDLAKVNWNKAVRAASEKAELLSALMRVAQGWGWGTEVEDLLWQAAKRFPDERWASQSLEKAYLEAGNTRGLLNVYSAMNRNDPKDFLIKNNLAAICLLLNTNTARAHEIAHEVYARHPTNSTVVSTYAFSLHLQGKTTEGLAILGKLGEPELRQPATAAYYALLLSAAGQAGKAKEYLAIAEQAPLLPEEKILLAGVKKAL